MLAIKLKKAAEDSQNKENMNYSGKFIVLQKQWAFFPALKIKR